MSIATVTAKVNKRIQDLTEQKANELAAIQNEIEKATVQEQKATEDLQKAMESTNLSAYTKAKQSQIEAKTAKEMYSARYKQLQHKEFVTEEESDKVIKSLLDAEKEAAADYEKETGEIVHQLTGINNRYLNDVRNAELTIKEWTTTIHANYIKPGTTYADGTNRSQNPVPVHSVPYKGCEASNKVSAFLEAIRNFL